MNVFITIWISLNFFLQQCTEIEFFSLINLELYFFITAVQLSNSFSVVGFR